LNWAPVIQHILLDEKFTFQRVYLIGFQSSIKSHPLWVTLYIKPNVHTLNVFVYHDVFIYIGGFFIEAGANNFESDSDSLHFELNHGWTVSIICYNIYSGRRIFYYSFDCSQALFEL